MDGLRIAFGSASPDVWTLSDSEYLKSIAWSRSAPAKLVEAAQAGDVGAGFGALCKAGFGPASPKGRKKAARQSPSKRTLWSRLAFDLSTSTEELLNFWENFPESNKRSGSGSKRKQHRAKSRKHQRRNESQLSNFDRWLERANRRRSLAPFELLILLELLQQIGSMLPAEIGWRAWRLALSAAIKHCVDDDPSNESKLAEDQRLVISGELPVAAGAVFDCVKKSGKIFRAGADFLARQLEANTDTDGMPNARLLPRISIWLAPIVRAAEWAKGTGQTLWNDDSEERFALLLERAAAICRVDGHLALSNGRSFGVAGLLVDASRLAGWKKRSPQFQYVRSVGNGLHKSRRAASRPGILTDENCPATQSDWARLACLRNDWSAAPDTLVVAHHDDKPLLDMTVLGQPLFSGTWDLEIAVDGKTVAFKDNWECTCWFTDDEADFLELQIKLDGEIKIERQVLLSRNEHFALLSDVVVGPDGSRIDYTSRLPLAGDVESETDIVTRECMIKSGQVRVRAFPLALPDDRIVGAMGSFAPSERSLVLKLQADGGLLAPILIDWEPIHRREDADWRTLTVTEDGKVLKRSIASGHRLRIGDSQRIYYRSLRSSGEMRAIIGHHTAHETVIGRFDEEGELDPILIVES